MCVRSLGVASRPPSTLVTAPNEFELANRFQRGYKGIEIVVSVGWIVIKVPVVFCNVVIGVRKCGRCGVTFALHIPADVVPMAMCCDDVIDIRRSDAESRQVRQQVSLRRAVFVRARDQRQYRLRCSGRNRQPYGSSGLATVLPNTPLAPARNGDAGPILHC